MWAYNIHPEIYSKLNLKKKLICNRHIGWMVFLTMRNEHLTNHKLKVKCLTSKNNKMGFFTLVLWGLAKVNESECQ